MNAYHIPRCCLIALAMLALAVFMAALPKGPALADETVVHNFIIEQAAPMEADLLRHLLSKQDLTADERVMLKHAMDGVYEELADASQPTTQAAPEGKGIIQSVNELLGVKSTGGKARG